MTGRVRGVAADMDRQRAARTVARLNRQADALRALYPPGGPIPEHVRARIAGKRRQAAAIESVYGPWPDEGDR